MNGTPKNLNAICRNLGRRINWTVKENYVIPVWNLALELENERTCVNIVSLDLTLGGMTLDIFASFKGIL